ncbi:MAG: DUF4386 domain-containing protein [Candidatus Odinarchaeota archaeon]
MSIEMQLSGFLFLFIIITNLASSMFGYKTIGDWDSVTQLQKINKNPTKFRISVVLILIEHFSIICLAVTLFIAFNRYNLILGIVWCIFRIGEALIQIYDKKNYWGLLNIALKYSDTSGTKKDTLIDSGRNILKTKEFRFAIAQILFFIGTLAYSILFVTYGVVPIIIGWFGIVASVLYGFGDVIFLLKSNFKILWNIGGLLIFLFEVVLGGWLLLFSPI